MATQDAHSQGMCALLSYFAAGTRKIGGFWSRTCEVASVGWDRLCLGLLKLIWSATRLTGFVDPRQGPQRHEMRLQKGGVAPPALGTSAFTSKNLRYVFLTPTTNSTAGSTFKRTQLQLLLMVTVIFRARWHRHVCRWSPKSMLLSSSGSHKLHACVSVLLCSRTFELGYGITCFYWGLLDAPTAGHMQSSYVSKINQFLHHGEARRETGPQIFSEFSSQHGWCRCWQRLEKSQVVVLFSPCSSAVLLAVSCHSFTSITRHRRPCLWHSVLWENIDGLTLHTREVYKELLLFVTCQLSALGVRLGAGLCLEIALVCACGCYYMLVRGEGGWEKKTEGRRKSVKSVASNLRMVQLTIGLCSGVLFQVFSAFSTHQGYRFGSVRQQEGRVVCSFCARRDPRSCLQRRVIMFWSHAAVHRTFSTPSWWWACSLTSAFLCTLWGTCVRGVFAVPL